MHRGTSIFIIFLKKGDTISTKITGWEKRQRLKALRMKTGCCCHGNRDIGLVFSAKVLNRFRKGRANIFFFGLSNLAEYVQLPNSEMAQSD